MLYKLSIKKLHVVKKERNILITGGYGNFGSKITKSLWEYILNKNTDYQITIMGRSPIYYKEFVDKASESYPHLNSNKIKFCKGDVTKNFKDILESEQPYLVIHSSGPFSEKDADLPLECANYGCHYLDLADNSKFIRKATETNINKLAQEKHLYIISGVSSVPGLSSAVVEEYCQQFKSIDSIEHSISTASDPLPGYSTLKNVLNLIGRPFSIKEKIGKEYIDVQKYNWQGVKIFKYPEVGYRLLSLYDVPDIELFQEKYTSIKSIKFYSGLANPMFHLGLCFLSCLVRYNILSNDRVIALASFIQFFAKYANLFKTSKSAFNMTISGEYYSDSKSDSVISNKKTFYLIADKGDGMYIPAIPAIVLSKHIIDLDDKEGKLFSFDPFPFGAYPCLGLVKLSEILQEMHSLNIKNIVL